ncbi:P27 family phage terminase small subunit [Globicatella sanguinis]
MADIKITELRQHMIDLVGEDDIFQVDLVNRYIDFVQEYRRVRRMVKKEEGASTVVNASQEYEKESVYHKQMRDINKEMLAIQRMINFNPKDANYDMDELTN